MVEGEASQVNGCEVEWWNAADCESYSSQAETLMAQANSRSLDLQDHSESE
jgi:hypothetical protein